MKYGESMEIIFLRRGLTVYIAGPMSGIKDLNYPAFNAAEQMIRDFYGFEVLNPARQPEGLEYEEYMKRGLEDVRACDVLVLLDGWNRSPGAQREYQLAMQLKKPFIHVKNMTRLAAAAKAFRASTDDVMAAAWTILTVAPEIEDVDAGERLRGRIRDLSVFDTSCELLDAFRAIHDHQEWDHFQVINKERCTVCGAVREAEK
jgi:hypothetical protein